MAIGTLALAASTISLALMTKRLATAAAEQIRASDLARRQQLGLIALERVYNEVLRLTEVAQQAAATALDPVAMKVAQHRLSAAIELSGGPSQWPQTDLMTRAGVSPDAIARQAVSALMEITDAFDDVENVLYRLRA